MKALRLRSGWGLAAVSLLGTGATAVLPACVAAPAGSDGDVGQTSAAIVDGTPVTADRFGSAMLWQCPGGIATCCPNGPASCNAASSGFKGGCSGTMVADQWMLTASHCVNAQETNAGGGTPLATNGIIAISADRASMATSDAIILNPTYDAALVHFESSITNAQGVAYTTPIYTGTSASLIGSTLYCQGFGTSDGQDSSPTYGTLRSAQLPVNNAITGWIAIDQNSSGQLLTFGDSGAGCFLHPPLIVREGLPILFRPNYVVGVQSLEFPGSDNLVGADGFASWASCTLAGNIWFSGLDFCMPRPIRIER